MALLFIIPTFLLIAYFFAFIGSKAESNVRLSKHERTGTLRFCAAGFLVVSALVNFGFLYWVNSSTPIWGERYTESERNNEYSRRAKAEVRRSENEKLLLINYSHAAVERLLKDPSSAKFSSESVSKKGAVCGFVNAKNSLGGYTGNQRYVYFNGATSLEDGGGSFSSKWNELCN